MNLAEPVDSLGVFERLCSTAMDSTSLGARVLAALVPANYPDLNALHRASGIAYSTLHAWKKGTANPRWEQIERLAELVGRDPFDLVGAGDGVRSDSSSVHLVHCTATGGGGRVIAVGQ